MMEPLPQIDEAKRVELMADLEDEMSYGLPLDEALDRYAMFLAAFLASEGFINAANMIDPRVYSS